MDQEIELRHLRYFVAVAEELHFGRAAQRLHLAQPPLSQQIRRLEELLGYPLFTRTSRSVTLTVAGHVFLDRARRTLQKMQLDVTEMRRVARGESGSLNIGFIGSAMLTSLPAVLDRYRKTYPSVELQFSESYTSRVMDGLLNSQLDIGFLRDADETEGVVTRIIYREPFIAILPATHPRAQQKSIAASALRNEPFVYYAQSAGKYAYEKPLALCGGEGFRPRIVQEASHWLTILRLIEVGIGVSIAPACVASIASKHVVCLPLRGAQEQSYLQLAWRADEKRTIVQNFADIAKHYGRNPSTFSQEISTLLLP